MPVLRHYELPFVVSDRVQTWPTPPELSLHRKVRCAISEGGNVWQAKNVVSVDILKNKSV